MIENSTVQCGRDAVMRSPTYARCVDRRLRITDVNTHKQPNEITVNISILVLSDILFKESRYLFS